MPVDACSLSDKEWQARLHVKERKLAWMDQEASPGPGDYATRSAFGSGRHFMSSDARGVTKWSAHGTQRRQRKAAASDGKPPPRYMADTASFRVRTSVTVPTAKSHREHPRDRVRSLTPHARSQGAMSPRSGAAPPEYIETPARCRSLQPDVVSHPDQGYVWVGEPEVYDRLYSGRSPRTKPAPGSPSVRPVITSVPGLPVRQAAEREHMHDRLRRLQEEVSVHQQAAAQQTQLYRSALRDSTQYSPRRQTAWRGLNPHDAAASNIAYARQMGTVA
eukprot:TRINITY_DN477_c1_g1_i1.p1 TRINITY_DN477_c1_g1~~TRINITY_DN477_c1_g1_i1.p1  ORF type:complete len:301 (+),score=63.59 TRINITY_DN477_c1_g1_i1:77-904(+)